MHNIIVPNLGWYWGKKLNESWGAAGSSGPSPFSDWNNRNNRDDDEEPLWLWIFLIVVIVAMFGGAIYLYKNNKPGKEYAPIKEKAANQILESAHSRALKSLDTINFANYVLIPQKTAERDSSHYSRKISKLVDNSGIDYLYKEWVGGGGSENWAVVFDKDAFVKEPNVQKALKGYEQACQQLAARRKVYKQQNR